MLRRSSDDAASKQRRLEDDLGLTDVSLRVNPKNYNTWEHRKWVLESMPSPAWAREMKLVDVFLTKDPRNCAFSVLRLSHGPHALTAL